MHANFCGHALRSVSFNKVQLAVFPLVAPGFTSQAFVSDTSAMYDKSLGVSSSIHFPVYLKDPRRSPSIPCPSTIPPPSAKGHSIFAPSGSLVALTKAKLSITNRRLFIIINRRTRMLCILTFVVTERVLRGHIFFTSTSPPNPFSYVPLQVNKFSQSILLIFKYRYLKSLSGNFYSRESDPPHKIMRYLIYYSILLYFSFHYARICENEMICIGKVPLSKWHLGGAGP